MNPFRVLATAGFLQNFLNENGAFSYTRQEIPRTQQVQFFSTGYREHVSKQTIAYYDNPSPYFAIPEYETVLMQKYVNRSWLSKSKDWHTDLMIDEFICIGISHKAKIIRYFTYKNISIVPSLAWERRQKYEKSN